MRDMLSRRLMTNVLAGLLLAAMLAIPACNTARPVETIRASGDRHYDYERYDAAASEYEEIVDRYPGDWRGQYRLGLTYLHLNRPAEALRALEIAHTERPNDPDIADALAEATYRMGDENRLFGFLRDQASRRQTVHAWLRVADYSIRLRDPDSAETAIKTAIAIDDGQTVEPYLMAARLSQELGNLDAAVRRLRQAYAIDPHSRVVRDRLLELGEIPGPTLALPPGR